MKTLIVTLKATLLASIMFLPFILTNADEIYEIVFIVPSMIPIFICCGIVNLFTIYPFFWLKKETTSNEKVFETYFPYYTIVAFIICVFFIIKFSLYLFPIIFFSIAFFTTAQSWVWVIKSNKNDFHEK
jgi:hypothetical protein